MGVRPSILIMEENVEYHVPVMLEECLGALAIKPDGIYVDVTFGGGGHSRAILERLGKDGHLYSFDQDIDAMGNVIDDDRFTFVRSNFRYLTNFMKYYGVEKIDGVLADLGVSSHHFDDESRGFSFRFDSKLDMRMNVAGGLTAAEVLNTYAEEQLADLFYFYGEIKQSRKLARAVVRRRETDVFEMTGDFVEFLKPMFFRESEKKEMTKAFQALRIEVNKEMDVLKEFLVSAASMLSEDGRLVVMTYHSLEDRLVKNFVKSGNMEGKLEKDFYGKVIAPLRAVNNKVIVPSAEEVERNPRARSAKLRIAEIN